ncbi:UvrD-helicase domain-containing protein [Propionibacteriaceae bacterium G1746]|uniref:UvrD-helicase domain-containing protein n=1 Tax=Aestuariimicrobium sp. G57 TaxID=3418485 RepID=UPI003C155BDB
MALHLVPRLIDYPEFTIDGVRLGVGTLVVEASAGTGKTTNIAKLTVRALAEGFCTVDQVALVTFTNKAATELRTRVHDHLAQAVAELAASSTPEAINLRAAAVDFDSATITTTHSFCQLMMTRIGVHVDHDATDSMLGDGAQMHAEIADDLFLQQQLAEDGYRADLAVVGRLVEKVLEMPHVPIRADQQQGVRGQLAARARTEYERRKRTTQVFTYEDLTGRLQQALAPAPDGTRSPAADVLGAMFRLVMIDEFQDTDQQQWNLLRDAFDGQAMLVLIGDPKQSIYRFRNADVEAYLAAAQQHERFSLRKNWRSSAAVTSGIDAILHQAQLGRGIQTPPATADAAAGIDTATGEWQAPVQLRLLGEDADLKRNLWHRAVDDLAQQVALLFSGSPPRVTLPRQQQAQRLKRSDVAVLVRSRWHVTDVVNKLNEAGVRANRSAGNLMKGTAAPAWLTVLDMLLQVDAASLRRAALTPLIGWDIPKLVEADEAEFDELARTVRQLSQLWTSDGFAAMTDTLVSAFSLHERMLQQPQGAQLLSDLLQVAELAHDHALRHRASPEGVRRWLQQAIDGEDETSTRIGDDDEAIQVMTIHAAKGLGFPVVLLPDLAFPNGRKDDPDTPRVHHTDDDTRAPLLDVSDRASRNDDDEELLEQLRLAYVALTRAQVGLRVWWGATTDVHRSALHRLLMSDKPGQVPPPPGQLQRKGAISTMQQRLTLGRFDPLEVVVAPQTPQTAPQDTAGEPEQPLGSPRAWTRCIDHTWRRTSYTGLTAALHDAAPHHGATAGFVEQEGAAVADGSGLDEPDLRTDSEVVATSGSGVDRMPSPLADVPGGADFGTFVHAILEHIDPQAPDLRAAIRTAAAPHFAAFGDEIDPEVLVEALVKVLHTPLGTLTGGTLADIPVSDRLPELDFELTMGGRGTVGTVGDLAQLFTDRALLPADDPLAHYGDVLLGTPAAEQTLNGFLNGSIDAVLRVGSKFVVVDYKTNTMPLAPGETLGVHHYHAAAMTQAMVAAHYPLQALLYSVALHRVLGWRLAGYDPEHHLGGVGYLFVRGMAGADTPVLGGMPAGVFTWRPPARFIIAADTILGGRR